MWGFFLGKMIMIYTILPQTERSLLMLRDIVLAAFRSDEESREENRNGDTTEEGRSGSSTDTNGYDTKFMDNAHYPLYLYHFN